MPKSEEMSAVALAVAANAGLSIEDTPDSLQARTPQRAVALPPGEGATDAGETASPAIDAPIFPRQRRAVDTAYSVAPHASLRSDVAHRSAAHPCGAVSAAVPSAHTRRSRAASARQDGGRVGCACLCCIRFRRPFRPRPFLL